MDKKEKLIELVKKYHDYKHQSKATELSEEETRSWINELLGIFDWDILNTRQIQQEKIVSDAQKNLLDQIDSTHTKPDYSLTNGDIVKAYLDAKKTSINIFTHKESAFQVRSYGWSAGLPCSFLTNFEQFVIFDCRYTPNKSDAASIGAIQLSIDSYVDNFEVLNNHLNRTKVYQNQLKKLYNVQKLEGLQTVDAHFNKLLSDFRVKLANDIYLHNYGFINEEELNYYVQIILDRIIFIRVCESKHIEKEGLLLDYCKKGFWDSFKSSCYAEFYEHYDGAIFQKDAKFHNLKIDNSVLCEFVEKLYYPNPYKFNAIPTKVIAKVYEEFLAYSLVIHQGVAAPVLKEEYVKTNGAIPTHEYIADAICGLSLSENHYNCMDDILNTKILDPCCGSGVFLISAYEYLSKQLLEITDTSNEWCVVNGAKKYLTIYARKELMSRCLYAIDIDATAVEVAKMSLALKMIDDVDDEVLSDIGAFEPRMLQDIHRNIKIGNTLVSTDINCSIKDIKYIKPIHIKDVFKDVFESNGGFDCIVGNPPYVETKHFKASSKTVHEYLKKNYYTFEGKVDLAVLFVEKAIDLLNKNGVLGIIIQRRWFKTNYGKAARNFITSGKHLYKLIDIETNSLFRGRITYVSVMLLTKCAQETVFYDLVKGGPEEVQVYFETKKEFSSIESGYFSDNIWAPELKEIFEIKNKYADKFGTVGSNSSISVRDGIQALWKKVYDIVDYKETDTTIKGKNGFGDSVEVEKPIVKPVIYNREFLPLKQLVPDAYRIFPYTGDDHKTKMTIGEIQRLYPKAYAYLMKNKKRIMENVSCNQGDLWAAYTREHNHDSFETAKIIIPMTAKETYATFVSDKGLYMDNANVWFINYAGNNVTTMKALTMIINSTIFSVLGKCGANQSCNGYYKFNKQFIDPIPLPNSKLTPVSNKILTLSQLFDDIKDLTSEFDKAPVTDKPLYQGILKSKWDTVDSICYDLYDATEDEINLIESVGRIESRIPGGDDN